MTDNAQSEYNNSINVTQNLTKSILGNEMANDSSMKTKKEKIRKARQTTQKQQLDDIRSRMNESQQRINEANQETGSYNWLLTLPLI